MGECDLTSSPWNNEGAARRGFPRYAAKGAFQAANPVTVNIKSFIKTHGEAQKDYSKRKT